MIVLLSYTSLYTPFSLSFRSIWCTSSPSPCNTKQLLHLGLCKISPLSGCLFSFSCRLGCVPWFWGVYWSPQWRSWVKFGHLLQNAPRVPHNASLPVSSRMNVHVESEGVSTDWTVMSESTVSKRVVSFHSMFCSLFPSVFLYSSSSLLPSSLLYETRRTNTTSRRGKRTRARCLSWTIWWDFFKVKVGKKSKKHKESEWNIALFRNPMSCLHRGQHCLKWNFMNWNTNNWISTPLTIATCH